MGRMESQLLVTVLLSALLYVHMAWANVVPATGNSVSLIALTKNGSQTFRCLNGGNWELASARATLVNASDPSSVLGSYLQIVDEASVIQWSILNSLADQMESGENYTYLSGKRVEAVSNDTDELYEITSRNEPIVSRYSFIQSHSDDSGPPNRDDDCNADTTVAAFHAIFRFYQQDVLPPPTAAIVGLAPPSSQRVLQSLFGSGNTVWKRTSLSSSGTIQWVLQSAIAVLSELPGAPGVGTFTVRPDHSATWLVDDPNGWIVTATTTHSTSLAAEDWPWQLYFVVSETGLLGNRTYVQLLSTKGGIPPSDEVIGAGETLSVDFSFVSWFYTSKS